MPPCFTIVYHKISMESSRDFQRVCHGGFVCYYMVEALDSLAPIITRMDFDRIGRVGGVDLVQGILGGS